VHHSPNLPVNAGRNSPGLGPPEALSNGPPPLTMNVPRTNPTGKEPAGSGKLWKQRGGGHPKPEGQSRNTLGITAEDRRRQHEQGVHSVFAGVENGIVQVSSASHLEDFKLHAQ